MPGRNINLNKTLKAETLIRNLNVYNNGVDDVMHCFIFVPFTKQICTFLAAYVGMPFIRSANGKLGPENRNCTKSLSPVTLYLCMIDEVCQLQNGQDRPKGLQHLPT